MRVLLFGHSGQVATEVRKLASPTLQIHALDRQGADFTNPKSVAAAVDNTACDAIINAVAFTAVDAAETNHHDANLVNHFSVQAMGEAAQKQGKPIVHLSTDYVFDGQGQIPRTPESATNPLGVYGRTKLNGEAALRAAKGSHAIIRTSWVFSAHGSNFVKSMLRLGGERDNLSVVADQIGGPTPAGAIAATTVKVAEALLNGTPGGTFHYAGTPEVSWADFAREIFVQADLDVDVADITSAEYPTPAERPKNSRLDCASLADRFGINRPEWRDALTEVLQELGAK